jgi:3-oxoacyl-[acyl-carrier protein] reductase
MTQHKAVAGAGAGMELAGRVALVTGAAKNIGRAIALELAAGGAAIAVNTRASRTQAASVAQEIRAAGGQAEVYIADIADAARVRAMVDGVVARFGRLDILVLNASLRQEVRFADMSFEQWREVMAITLDGSFHCIKAALPAMMAAGAGNIIALTGDSALVGTAGKVQSSAAKCGLTGMVRALAREVGEHGIRVNCVSPGYFNTPRPAQRSARPDAKGLIPLGRWGEVEEIGAAVRFLCGPGGGYITGQTLHLNGGQTMF